VQTSSTTFKTVNPGRLLITYTGSGQLQCATSSFVRWWLQVDGQPVHSSAMQLGEAVTISFDYNGFPAITLTGVTDGIVPAGTHTLALVGGCTSGANGGSATSGLPGVGSVVNIGNHAAGLTARVSLHPARSCVRTSQEVCH
jgi:hypothetical protein